MGTSEKTALLVISFGTSYEETRKKTIEQIEKDLHDAYPGMSIIPRMDQPAYPCQITEARRNSCNEY